MNQPAHEVSFEQLLDLQTGHLDSDAAQTLNEHVRTCSRCRDELASIVDLLATMRSDLSEATNEARLQRRRTLFADWQAARPQHPAAWRDLAARIAGVLRADSRQRLGAAGVRGPADLDTVKLLYEAGPYDIDLRVTMTPQDSRHVLGQIMVLDPIVATQGILVQVLQADLERAASVADALGEFVLEDIAAGIYDFVLETAVASYVLPDVDLT